MTPLIALGKRVLSLVLVFSFAGASFALTEQLGYEVRAGDVLSVDIVLRGSLADLSKLSTGLPLEIVGESVFSHHVITVAPDGFLYLPGVASVGVAGMTLEHVEQVIATRLNLPFERNYVSVALVRTNTLALYIWGEVKQPGKYLIDHPTNLIEALSQAGGPTDRARMSSVEIIRHGEKAARVDLSLKQLRSKGTPTIALQPYDTVYIPKKLSPSEFFVFALLTAITTASSVYVASKTN